jgi:hypothetical protein
MDSTVFLMQMNFYPNPNAPANHTDSNTKVNVYNMIKTETHERENNELTKKLETVLEKVSAISNPVNSLLVQEFYQFIKDNRK